MSSRLGGLILQPTVVTPYSLPLPADTPLKAGETYDHKLGRVKHAPRTDMRAFLGTALKRQKDANHPATILDVPAGLLLPLPGDKYERIEIPREAEDLLVEAAEAVPNIQVGHIEDNNNARRRATDAVTRVLTMDDTLHALGKNKVFQARMAPLGELLKERDPIAVLKRLGVHLMGINRGELSDTSAFSGTVGAIKFPTREK